MSIYNKTWAVDEEITSDKLNQMSADANNAVDNIHPQYAYPEISMESNTNPLTHYLKHSSINPGGWIIVGQKSQAGKLYGAHQVIDSRWSIFSNSNAVDWDKYIGTLDFIKAAGKTNLNLHFYGQKIITGGLSYSFFLNSITFKGIDNALIQEDEIEITSDTGYAAYSLDIDISSVTAGKNIRMVLGMHTAGIANDTANNENWIVDVRATVS
jgi:hypothetical protein